MIKLPDAIVIYPQRKSVPEYLLCWIPAREYGRVVKKRGKKSELRKLYPEGIELELSEDGLEEAGVVLEADPEALRQAYVGLAGAGVVPESGMVELETLQGLLEEDPSQPELELAAAEAGPPDLADQLQRRGLLEKLRAGPPMTEGDEATQVYRRMDVKQRPAEASQNQGGE